MLSGDDNGSAGNASPADDGEQEGSVGDVNGAAATLENPVPETITKPVCATDEPQDSANATPLAVSRDTNGAGVVSPSKVQDGKPTSAETANVPATSVANGTRTTGDETPSIDVQTSSTDGNKSVLKLKRLKIG